MPPPPAASPGPANAPAAGDYADDETDKDWEGPPPYTGKMADVMSLLEAGKVERAIVDAVHWQNEEPGDVVALVALGESLEAAGNKALAARAYGSILDLFPQRADMRRFAAERLERVGGATQALATDAFAKAAVDRPDHLNGHRLYAFALLRDGRVPEAFAEIEAGLSQSYPPGRFLGGDWILRDDLGLVAAVWLKQEPSRRAVLEKQLAKFGAKLPTEPSLRFVLYWETDANDVDFHIHDAKGGHAFYRAQAAPLRRRALRRRHDRLRPRVLHHRGHAARVSVPPPDRTTTRRARWATGWASSRSSSTTARAASSSRSGRTW